MLTLGLLLLSTDMLAQDGVLIDYTGNTRDNSAVLDVRSSTQGAMVPRMTEAQRDLISLPATSLLIFQTDNSPGYYYNSGTAALPDWQRLLYGNSAPPTGSGTLNYLAKWTPSGTQLGNSQLFDDGTNVGISVSPSYKLDVNGVVNAATGYRQGGAAAAAGSYLRGNGSEFVSSAIQIGDLPGSGQITVNASGVGITVSGSPVALGGTVTITSNATASNTASTLVSRDASGNFSAGLITADLDGQWRAKDDRIIEPNSITSRYAKFGFTSYNNNNTYPYADYLHLRSYQDASGGNDNLVMFAKDQIAMRVYQQAWNSATPYSSYKTVAFVEDLSSFSGLANPSATIGLTAINGSATTAMRSDAAPALSQAIVPTWTGTHTFNNGTYSALFMGGNVGVGDLGPDAPLSIQAASTSDQALFQSWRYQSNSDTYTLKLKQTVTSGVVRYTFDMINNSTAYNDFMTFDRGNVGIGETVPDFRLHVKGKNANSEQMTLGGTTTGNFALTSQDGGDYGLYAGVGNTGKAWLQVGRHNTATAYNLIMQASGGNVGIGTISPGSYKLNVQGGSAQSLIASSSDAPLVVQGTNTWSGIRFQDSGNSDHVWFNGGNSTFAIGGGGSNVSGKKLHVDGGATISANYDASTVPTNGLAVEGSTGIGINAPTAKLQVVGGSQVATSILTDGYTEDVSGIVQGNYIPSHSWDIGTGSVGVFAENGGGENARVWGEGPNGHRAMLWQALPNGGGNADGGWNTTTFDIDHTKTYRSSVWIKKTGTTAGTTYIGCHGGGGNTITLAGATNTNPYFWSGDLPVIDRWYLLVGYIHGSGDASTTSYGGIYDGTTGAKVLNMTDYKLPTTATQQRQRTYLYYNSNSTNRQYWWDPRFEEVNGKEPSIQAMLGVSPGSVLDDDWTISGNNVYSAVSGNVGIGLTNPTYKLHVNGAIRTLAINETSDVRMKKDISDISNSLEKILEMRGVTYNWRQEEFPESDFENGLQYGLIAQELEKIVPELVETDSEGWKSIEYSHLVPLLIEAIKEQQAIIKGQQGTIDSQKAHITATDKRVDLVSIEMKMLKDAFISLQTDINAGGLKASVTE